MSRAFYRELDTGQKPFKLPAMESLSCNSRLSLERPWQAELSLSLRTAEELHEAGLIQANEVALLAPVLDKYHFLLPRYYAGLIDRADPECPIRRQAIPSVAELESSWGQSDPLSDGQFKPAPHLTHRYDNRVLLHLTSNCSMYCRYCFRKTLLNEEKHTLFSGSLEDAFAYLEKSTQIREVIFSGGDPFLVADTSLKQTLQRLSGLDHLKTVRFHTRVPVTLPFRVTEALAQILCGSRLDTVVVTHFNHPREITPESRAACGVLSHAGVWLFNQSVLLRGVNANAKTLAALSEQLMSMRVAPYYLHHPDPAKGTRHFSLSFQEGWQIFETLRGLLPGYLVPRYVVDDTRRPYKTNVGELINPLGL